MTGQCEAFFERSGYGFIKGDDGVTYFVHYSELSEDFIDNMKGRRNLYPGQRVRFNGAEAVKGYNATCVTPEEM